MKIIDDDVEPSEFKNIRFFLTVENQLLTDAEISPTLKDKSMIFLQMQKDGIHRIGFYSFNNIGQLHGMYLPIIEFLHDLFSPTKSLYRFQTIFQTFKSRNKTADYQTFQTFKNK